MVSPHLGQRGEAGPLQLGLQLAQLPLHCLLLLHQLFHLLETLTFDLLEDMNFDLQQVCRQR